MSKQYFAVENENGIAFTSKLATASEAIAEALGVSLVQVDTVDPATIGVYHLGSRKDEAQREYKRLVAVRHAREEQEAREERNREALRFAATYDAETECLKNLRDMVRRYEDAKAKFAEQVQKDAVYAIESLTRDVVDAHYMASKAAPAIRWIDREQVNPVRALSEILKEVEREVRTNRHVPSSTCMVHNAVAIQRQASACKFLDGRFETHRGLWRAERRDEARAELGLEPVDYEAEWGGPRCVVCDKQLSMTPPLNEDGEPTCVSCAHEVTRVNDKQ